MKLRIMITLTALAVTSVPGSAYGVSSLKSYSGSDYSVNSTSGRIIDACDREADGHSVKAEFTLYGSNKTPEIGNGGGSGTCARATLSNVVYRHRIVEEVPLSRDDYGRWVFPS